MEKNIANPVLYKYNILMMMCNMQTFSRYIIFRLRFNWLLYKPEAGLYCSWISLNEIITPLQIVELGSDFKDMHQNVDNLKQPRKSGQVYLNKKVQ